MALRETGTERKTVMAKFPKSFPLDVIGAYRIAGLSMTYRSCPMVNAKPRDLSSSSHVSPSGSRMLR
ncbi:hypothetical protein J1N35_018360 [Gossypium stocksii]|uniref:Uncharacterized protein n=1 Tax=Gossypium stocksii TaxID=47602 RepID=A0A9D4A6L2_9ROSI|nr:hypothetical protein J1N35_018360 [Gossypium stocksii]